MSISEFKVVSETQTRSKVGSVDRQNHSCGRRSPVHGAYVDKPPPQSDNERKYDSSNDKGMESHLNTPTDSANFASHKQRPTNNGPYSRNRVKKPQRGANERVLRTPPRFRGCGRNTCEPYTSNSTIDKPQTSPSWQSRTRFPVARPLRPRYRPVAEVPNTQSEPFKSKWTGPPPQSSSHNLGRKVPRAPTTPPVQNRSMKFHADACHGAQQRPKSAGFGCANARGQANSYRSIPSAKRYVIVRCYCCYCAVLSRKLVKNIRPLWRKTVRSDQTVISPQQPATVSKTHRFWNQRAKKDVKSILVTISQHHARKMRLTCWEKNNRCSTFFSTI